MAQPIKKAEEHIASLRDDRRVFIDGAPAGDVTEHAALRNSTRTTANLYDYQADPANAVAIAFESLTSRHRVNRAWQMPESYQASKMYDTARMLPDVLYSGNRRYLAHFDAHGKI